MTPIPIFKAHGLGNDYLVLEASDLPSAAEPAVARLLCDRHLGVGSDGVLVRESATAGGFGVRIINPDGSEAEKSGNGLRIFAAYLLRRGEINVGEAVSVRTLGGDVGLRVVAASDLEIDVEAEMGTGSFPAGDGEEIEVAGSVVRGVRVSVGNPHFVVRDPLLDPARFRLLGAELERHPSFPGGSNVQFAHPAADGGVSAWVWERGAGETRASGSSACAVAAAAVRAGWVPGPDVEVRMPGGVLRVRVRADGSLLLRGPVRPTFSATLAPELLHAVGALASATGA